jgi:hypothetical protein
MHVAHQLSTSQFEAFVDGARVEVTEVMPAWTPDDRFGVVINDPFGALGASLLLQLAIARFYEVDPARRDQSPLYPEIYLFHVGGPHGDFSSFDFWPPRKEVKLTAGQPLTLLEAINDRAITRLALPAGPTGDLANLDHGPSSWAERATATHRLKSCFFYRPDGCVDIADMELRATDPRALENIAETLDIVNVAATSRAEVEAGVYNFVGRTVASDVINWANLVELRKHEVPGGSHDPVAAHSATSRRETYRRVGAEHALRRLASL